MPLIPPSFVLLKKLIIASRKSRLAMWQAKQVQQALQKHYPAIDIAIEGMLTTGDQILDRPLSEVGNKSLFVNALETALQEGRADLAVHSLKDVPATVADGFALAAILERGNPLDACVLAPAFSHCKQIADLPAGSVVGTSSLRRLAWLQTRYPHLQVLPVRGNIDTRLSKLDAGHYAMLVLAAAGLERLGLEARIHTMLPAQDCLPAPGQGALAVETVAHRKDLLALLAPLHHAPTAWAIAAERHVSLLLQGSCDVPLASFAQWVEGDSEEACATGHTLFLRALITAPDGQHVHSAKAHAVVDSLESAQALGETVAQTLVEQGARESIQVFMQRAEARARGRDA